MSKPKRRLKSADITFISLCPRGANKMETIYKSDDDTFELKAVSKEMGDFEEKGELLNVVYVPETPDSQGDIASAEVIKEAAYSYMLNGANVDIRHDTEALSKEDADVAESFIVQKDDPRFVGFTDTDGNSVEVTGGWATVIKINNEELRQKYRDGEWGGVSMFGQAQVEDLEKEEELEKEASMNLSLYEQDANTLMNAIKRLFGFSEKKDLLSKAKKTENKNPQEEIEMDKTEMAELLKASNESLIEGLTKALKPEVEETLEKESKETDGYAGDPSDIEAIKKHMEEVEVKKHAAEVDWSDPASIEKHLEWLEDRAEGKKDVKVDRASSNVKGVQKQETAEVSQLSKEKEDAEVDRLLQKYGQGD